MECELLKRQFRECLLANTKARECKGELYALHACNYEAEMRKKYLYSV
jgi:hypothetical protein